MQAEEGSVSLPLIHIGHAQALIARQIIYIMRDKGKIGQVSEPIIGGA